VKQPTGSTSCAAAERIAAQLPAMTLSSNVLPVTTGGGMTSRLMRPIGGGAQRRK